MRDNMTLEDAINVVHVLGGDLASNGDEDLRKLVSAATSLVSHVQEQAGELERERARRRGTGQREAAMPEGHRLEYGVGGCGRRDFLAGRGVHAGETLYLLTYSGWHPVRYESNICTCPCRAFERTSCSGSHAKRALRGRRNCGGRAHCAAAHRDSTSSWTPSRDGVRSAKVFHAEV